MAAYNERNVRAMRRLVGDARVYDVGLYDQAGPTLRYDDAEDWLAAAERLGSRMSPRGYIGGGIVGMEVTRDRADLAELGIAALGSSVEFEASACEVQEVRLVDALGSPVLCAFYDRYPDLYRQAEAPAACRQRQGALARFGHHAAWTGTGLAVLGGQAFGFGDVRIDGFLVTADGVPRPIPAAPLSPVAHIEWIAGALYAWGGQPARLARWQPASGNWTVLEAPPVDSDVHGQVVWTGAELIMWGSTPHYRDTVALAYRPTDGAWRQIAGSPLHGRADHTLVWTGAEVIAWGGINRNLYNDGAAYDPAGDTWRRIPRAPVGARYWHTAVWTGEEMIVWGGTGPVTTDLAAAAYHPGTNAWRRIADAPFPPRHWHTAVWAGSEMIVWGGHEDYRVAHGGGASYDPAADVWRGLPDAGMAPRCLHTATWTGTAMLVLGGWEECGHANAAAAGDGAAYDPAGARWEPFPAAS